MNLDFTKTESLQNRIYIAVHAINSFGTWLEVYNCLKLDENGSVVETGEKILMFDKANPSTSAKGYDNISNYLLGIIQSFQSDPVVEIESEFISNLTNYNTESISSLAHIYKCKWKGQIPQSDVVYGCLTGKDGAYRNEAHELYNIVHDTISHELLDGGEIEIILGRVEHIGELLNRVASALQKLFVKFQPQEQNAKTKTDYISQYTISEDNKTDFIKIISAMYDCRMFNTTDGNIASNKKELIKALGQFFNTKIDDCSKFLSAAKNANNYLDIFDKIKKKGEDYYKKQ